MPSLSSSATRPVPQQERAARTHALFLDTAETLFVEVGYDAATMTAIAERANASIGALYRWFPDKAALGTALMARYGQEIEEHWTPVFAAAERTPTPEFAAMMIDTTMAFVREKPAYFVLREAPIKRSRGPAARKNLREAFARAFRSRKPALSHDRAYLIANVVVDTIKGFLAGAASSTFKEQQALTVEFTTMLSLYLKSIFD
ncbi:MAG TPA: TetR/AcrR family transcriptional regulator [Edaphobacter sp.]|nr:TetR/AcrR family transcriptional regulator [Edaphobacter sp.]